MDTELGALVERYSGRMRSLVLRRSIKLKVHHTLMRNGHPRPLTYGSTHAVPVVSREGSWSVGPSVDTTHAPRMLHDIGSMGRIDGQECQVVLYELLAHVREMACGSGPIHVGISGAESAHEALLWRDLFRDMADILGARHDRLRCSVRVDAYPLGYELEEFVYILREHISGLSLDAWSFIASMVHWNLEDPSWMLGYSTTLDAGSMVGPVAASINDIASRHGMTSMGTGTVQEHRPDLRPTPPDRKFRRDETRAAIASMIDARALGAVPWASCDPGCRTDSIKKARVDVLVLSQRMRHWERRPDAWAAEDWSSTSVLPDERLGEHSNRVITRMFELASDDVIAGYHAWDDRQRVMMVKAAMHDILHSILLGTL